MDIYRKITNKSIFYSQSYNNKWTHLRGLAWLKSAMRNDDKNQ